ncbi:MutS [Gossypium arboreum]|uniref:MutS n=1 Tax=Gossypium arboreum TaxID=29729 RepID=A0A0B0MMX9_GOSAR|nr:MutS [Gossypium arboreum]
MAIHARMLGRVLGHVKPVGILTYATRPSHTPVCWAVWSIMT